ncbi:MAG: glycoside hydrolase family 26 protein [Acidomyces sp. 'richmondensis']|nr:MAG: glycoside hydrolase family 26 protein [Acidomyces sp. 'richmondensis']
MPLEWSLDSELIRRRCWFIVVCLDIRDVISILENSLAVQYGVPVDSMLSYDGIYVGWAPDWEQPVTIAELNQATGQNGATYNVYSQITQTNADDGSYNGDDRWPTSDIISSASESIVVSQGTTVWLRFAHEMNCYSDAKCNNGDKLYPNLNSGLEDSEVYPIVRSMVFYFMTARSNMYNAVSAVNNSSAHIYMFWSPNVDTEQDPVAPWFPSVDQVDIVGVFNFTKIYGDIYNTYAAPNGIPFAIGEIGNDDGISDREASFKAIINPDNGELSNHPLYVSCTWFDYTDFFLVNGQSEATVTETISNTESGSAS